MESLTTIIIGAAGTIGGLFIGTRKARAEARQSELDGVEKAITIWREMAEELSAKVKTLEDKVVSLEAEIAELRQDNTRMRAELEKYDR